MVHCGLSKIRLAFDVRYIIFMFTSLTYLVSYKFIVGLVKTSKTTCVTLALEMLSLNPSIFELCSWLAGCRVGGDIVSRREEVMLSDRCVDVDRRRVVRRVGGYTPY